MDEMRLYDTAVPEGNLLMISPGLKANTLRTVFCISEEWSTAVDVDVNLLWRSVLVSNPKQIRQERKGWPTEIEMLKMKRHRKPWRRL